MKTKKATNNEEKKLPKGFKLNSSLNEKYANQPLFKEKADKANEILKAVAFPKL